MNRTVCQYHNIDCAILDTIPLWS
ncbi:MAG: hypothetical protein JWN14_1519, partial [Chthonomonadales bacterium]|nr:hypothetical protein [Chthonomonadales bacterium]